MFKQFYSNFDKPQRPLFTQHTIYHYTDLST